MFRVLTVAREYGSGGAMIARKIAESLRWELLDKTLITEIARATRMESELVGRFDERVDSWLHRVSRRGLWHGAFDGVAAVAGDEFLDAETVAEVTRRVIGAAYERGNCVIVGRGAQCVLQDRADAFHVFIYAPWRQRIARIQQRMPAETDVEGVIRSIDRERAEYIRLHFGCNWSDPHLYHMLIDSELGEDEVASIIVEGLVRGGSRTA
ncbi:MAG TPA: cytidylate kinase-like family protein [Bryobacteraceae bacterium]|nr:cytidylate kinase-like family protein [Bryobacteraceae bacterium]